jgi:hypothetical protein
VVRIEVGGRPLVDDGGRLHPPRRGAGEQCAGEPFTAGPRSAQHCERVLGRLRQGGTHEISRVGLVDDNLPTS